MLYFRMGKTQWHLSANIDKTRAIAQRELAEWIVKQGPNYFGIPWSFPVALCGELQITGKAAQILN